MAQVTGFLTPVQETWIEFLDPGCSSAQALLLWTLKETNIGEHALAFSLSCSFALSLSLKIFKITPFGNRDLNSGPYLLFF